MTPEMLLNIGLFLAGNVAAFAGAFFGMKTTLALLLHRVAELEGWVAEFRKWKHETYTHDMETLRKELYERTRNHRS